VNIKNVVVTQRQNRSIFPFYFSLDFC
jgi:hypothetical protein